MSDLGGRDRRQGVLSIYRWKERSHVTLAEWPAKINHHENEGDLT